MAITRINKINWQVVMAKKAEIIPGFLAILKNLREALTLLIKLWQFKRLYRLDLWFLLLPHIKPQTRVTYNFVKTLFPRNIQIIDLGCGIGSFTWTLLNQGFKNIICLDINPRHLQVCKALIGKSCLNIHLVRADIHFLPLRSKVFDLAIMLDFSYDLSNFRRCLCNISKILKPEGLLIMDCYYESTSIGTSGTTYSKKEINHIVQGLDLRPEKFFPVTFGYVFIAKKSKQSIGL